MECYDLMGRILGQCPADGERTPAHRRADPEWVKAVDGALVAPARNGGGEEVTWKLAARQVVICHVDTINMYESRTVPTAGTRNSCQ